MLSRVNKEDLGYYWGLVSLSGNVGASLAPVGMALICDYIEENAEGAGWKAIFVLGGGVAILISVGVHLLLQPPCEDAAQAMSRGPSQSTQTTTESKDMANGRSRSRGRRGRGSRQRARPISSSPEPSPASAAASAHTETHAPGNTAVSLLSVLSQPTVWLMMLVNMIIYLPLKACQDWGVIIAIQHYKMSPTIGSSLITWHELGGVLSGFVAPLLSDICGGRRTVVVAGCSALAALAFAALHFIGVSEDSVDSGGADNPKAENLLSVAGRVQ